MIFNDRKEAAKKLARALMPFKYSDSVVMALPRGGVVLGSQISKELKSPLGLILVRKIGHPYFPEYAIGALAEDQEPIYNEYEASLVGSEWLHQAVISARKIIAQRKDYYFVKHKQPEIEGRIVIVVDDGVATGYTMQAALSYIKTKRPKRVIVAVPVASKESIGILENLADDIITISNPEDFAGSVGAHYKNFSQVDDHDVKTILEKNAEYFKSKNYIRIFQGLF